MKSTVGTVNNLSSPIGVFDSGIGGLTVLKALQNRLPNESYIYLGDTARLPYGTKTGDTIIRYALQAAEKLVAADVKMLVIACNTASAYALTALKQKFPGMPVIGVTEPGARAAAAATNNGRIAVISTESTARAGAYPKAIANIDPAITVSSIACSLLVSLVEEGWTEGDIPAAIVRRYLQPLFSNPEKPDTLVLGCTHFPLLKNVITEAVEPCVTIIDSGTTTGEAVAAQLAKLALETISTTPEVRVLATDGPERFARVAMRFLQTPVTPGMIELVDLNLAPVDRQAAERTDRARLPAAAPIAD